MRCRRPPVTAGASVHHGELPNAVTRAELVAYLHEDAISYVPTGAEAGFDEQLFPDGLLLRFAADPPMVRAAEGTPPELRRRGRARCADPEHGPAA